MRNLPQRPDVTRPPAVSPGLRAAGLTAREQIGLAVLAVDRVRRGAVARMRRSRLLRWRYRAPAADELLLGPPDLRAQDASFADEVADGSLGLAGAVVHLGGRSPFALAPPNRAWARELDGFGWLRHLEAARSREAQAIARRLVGDWIRRSRWRQRHGWELEIVARRVISWLGHAGLILDGAERRLYAAVMGSLAHQVTTLSVSWGNAPDGHPRLLALIALVHADLCIAGYERQLDQTEKLLAAELERQVLPDGCHVSRNPALLVELLLDLLPLRQCFAARGRTPLPALAAAIGRMTAMLHHLSLGDGTLARFNGMGVTERGTLIAVLAYDHAKDVRDRPAMRSGYVRLERGSTIAVLDAGAPPPLELAAAAGAGCLSFEMSAGEELFFVNAGAPGPADLARAAVARATASHNTLCVAEQSSAKLIRNAGLERRLGGPPLRHPDHVTCEVREADGAIEVEASHDGYADRLGLIHTRFLRLEAGGLRLAGIDSLAAAKGILRFSWDVPLAIHFHLHPDVAARLGPSTDTVELLLASGAHWRLTAAGAAVTIEDSVHLADPSGPRRAQQIVLRALCYGAAQVAWSVERIKAGRPLDPKARKPARAGSALAERLAETGAGFDAPARSDGG